jgi:peptidyl-tRNA hydrolase, PTH1 family
VTAWVVAGLGNPGKRYEMTRHNFGDLVVRGVAAKFGWAFKEEKRFQALLARGVIGEKPFFLLLPTTYMNESGRAVKALLDYFKLSPSQLIVVCDDLALPFGTLRLRPEGSAGGHNGLKSVEGEIGTSRYARLRMGIGRGLVEIAEPMIDYVLDTFSSEEMVALPKLLERGGTALVDLAESPIEIVMNRVNTTLRLS